MKTDKPSQGRETRTLAELLALAACPGNLPVLLTYHDLYLLTTLDRQKVRRMVIAGDFPKPVLVGTLRLWRLADYQAWSGKLAA